MPPPSRATTAGRVFNDLRNVARRTGRSTDELLVLYVLERFLFRVSKSPHRDKLILKGGLLLAALDARRATRDADLLATRLDSDVDTIVGLVREIASVAVDDGVVLDADSARTEPIREDDLYPGVRIVVPATVGRAKVKLALDVNFGDPVTPEAVVTEFPQLLGDGTFPLLSYPIETVLAEKITTMIALGDLNTRDRDWADVWRLTGIHDLNGRDIQAALERTASHRGVQLVPLSQVVSRLPQLRQATYTAWRTRQSVDGSAYPEAFAELVRRVMAFADVPLADSTQNLRWSADAATWTG